MEFSRNWSSKALANLKSIESYISEDSTFHAKRVVNEIINHADNLKIFPEMGHALSDFPDLGLRQLIKYSYRIIYAFDGKIVTIVAVVHSKQKYIEGYLAQIPL
jgi:addiction module RelE/StbE family toxin